MPLIDPSGSHRRRFVIGDQVYRFVTGSDALEGPYYISRFFDDNDEPEYGLCKADGSEILEGRISEQYLGLRFDGDLQAGEIDSMSQMIDRFRSELKRTTPDHPNRVAILNNLGSLLGRRFEQTGSLEDIDYAIEAFQVASKTTPQDHPDHVTILGNLGSWLGSKYEVTGSTKDLDTAIKVLKTVVGNTSTENPSQAGRLSNLGNAVGMRYERTDAMDDLNEAIRISEKAFDLVSRDDQTRAAILGNLSSWLCKRWELTGLADDINRARILATLAGQLTPENHPYRSIYENRVQSLSRQPDKISSTEAFGHPIAKAVDEEDVTTITSAKDTIFSESLTFTHSSHTTQALSNLETDLNEAVPANLKTERLVLWLDELRLCEQDIAAPAESVTLPEQSNIPTAISDPSVLAHGTRDPVSGKSDMDWEMAALARANAILDESSNPQHPLSISEVIRDRVWPFYSNWLHKLLGPCTRTAEFDRDEDGEIISVTIYITCKRLPKPTLQKIIQESTLYLVSPEFSTDQVIVDIDEGTSSPSTPSSTEVERISVISGPIDLKMGDGITSSVRRKYDQKGELGSSGPWLRTSSSNVFLYTNEHVVRSGMEICEKTVVTHPGRRAIGDVVLTSAKDLVNSTADRRNRVYPTMECYNEEVHESVRSGNNWLADWAIVKFQQAPTKPIEMMVAGDGKLCHHVNHIIHVPLEGHARAIGAGSCYRPWHAMYTAQLDGCGIPTQLSPGMWDNNSIELACWSLSRYKKASYSNLEWYDHGIGISGDSGAGVVDSASGSLCGLVIGET